MAPPLPPKPSIGPLVRRTLFAAALGGVAGCPTPSRIGPTPPRIGAVRIGPPVPYYEDAAVQPAPAPDAGVDAADDNRPMPIEKAPIRIGKPPVPRTSSLLRGEVLRGDGSPVARTSLRVALDGGTRIVTTDGEGRFVLDGLLPGEYPVVIETRGHAPVRTLLASTRDIRVTIEAS